MERGEKLSFLFKSCLRNQKSSEIVRFQNFFFAFDIK